MSPFGLFLSAVLALTQLQIKILSVLRFQSKKIDYLDELSKRLDDGVTWGFGHSPGVCRNGMSYSDSSTEIPFKLRKSHSEGAGLDSVGNWDKVERKRSLHSSQSQLDLGTNPDFAMIYALLGSLFDAVSPFPLAPSTPSNNRLEH